MSNTSTKSLNGGTNNTTATNNTVPNTPRTSDYNPIPQVAPGAAAAVGHTVENSIPLSIFPIATDRFCLAFCGLPGRGKTHISRRTARYLSFFHAVPVQVFNMTEYRLQMCGTVQDADWFDITNEKAQAMRDIVHDKLIEDVKAFFTANSNGVAILDSTNPTHHRRVALIEKLRVTGAKVIFIEVTNGSDRIMNREIIQKSIRGMPDFKDVEYEKAEADYLKRVETYSSYFETLDSNNNTSVESKWSYLKCDHERQHFVINKISGYLPLKIIHFIMSLRTNTKAFYLSRHGQSEYNAIGRIGGDSGLSQHGVAYARALADFVHNKVTHNEEGGEVASRLWTSTLRRTKETAQFIQQNKLILTDECGGEYEWVQMRPRAWHHLDELFAGSCDGMTYEEIEATYPEEFARRNTDKLAYRYPRGESYLDVIARLEPIIIEMERHREPLLIIGHQGILRIIYAFYMNLTRAEAPYVSVPLNCVLELVPSAFTCTETVHKLYSPPAELSSDGQQETKAFNADPQSH